MKIGNNFSAFNISAEGLSLQRKKMNLIAENIANTSTTKTVDGEVYKRKTLAVQQKKKETDLVEKNKSDIKLKTTNQNHIKFPAELKEGLVKGKSELIVKEIKNEEPGQLTYMPDHPDADAKGYVLMPNVNIIVEMTDMIAATRSYEANLTALNSSKQMAKDSLEI